jgi:hypothetical protein
LRAASIETSFIRIEKATVPAPDREGADVVDRPGLADAAALRGRSAHAIRKRPGLARHRERLIERRLLGVVLAHVDEQVHDVLRRRSVGAREA